MGNAMIQALQRKFIRIAMLAATLLMVVFLLAINISNLWATNREMMRTLKIIVANSASARPDFTGIPTGNADIASSSDTAGNKSGADPAPAGPADGENETQAGISDLLNSERYFFVRVTADGEVIYSDLTHISSVDEEEARAVCRKAEAKGKTNGRAEGFIFLKSVSKTTGGAVYAFLDDQEEIKSVLRVAVITAVIGAVCWLIALVLVIRMSGRAIRPIAENIERQKQFVTNAGHEIRTPLAIIRANADVLALHEGENKWIDNIRDQTDRLSALTRNMLTLARADEEGNERPPVSSFDPGALFRETVERFARRAEARQVTLAIKAEPGKSFRYSRAGFEQLISILADNAVIYTNEGGRIEAEEYRKGHEAVIVFRNTCGRMPDHPEQLFDRFYREDRARTQEGSERGRKRGFGIGLSAARAIAEQGGGSITAEVRSGMIVFEAHIREMK